jgi:hypothetical protein
VARCDERRCAAAKLFDIAKIDGGGVMRADESHALGGDQAPELFHAARRHSGDVHRYLFEGKQRSLAPPIANRVGHFRAAAIGG